MFDHGTLRRALLSRVSCFPGDSIIAYPKRKRKNTLGEIFSRFALKNAKSLGLQGAWHEVSLLILPSPVEDQNEPQKGRQGRGQGGNVGHGGGREGGLGGGKLVIGQKPSVLQSLYGAGGGIELGGQGHQLEQGREGEEQREEMEEEMKGEEKEGMEELKEEENEEKIFPSPRAFRVRSSIRCPTAESNSRHRFPWA